MSLGALEKYSSLGFIVFVLPHLHAITQQDERYCAFHGIVSTDFSAS
jgi:hypothetical protein